MFKSATTMAAICALLVCQATPCGARGGGGFHGGGFGGFHGGGFGGFHGGGFGGFGGGVGPRPDFGGGAFGARPAFSDLAGGGFGQRADGFNGGRGLDGDRAAQFQNFLRGDGTNRAAGGGRSFDGSRIGNLSHTNLPSDFGFGHAGARSYLPAGHATHNWSNNTMRNRANTVRNNFYNHNYFNGNWWRNHPGAWFAAGWAAGTAWAWTTWPGLYGWYGWGAVAPIYYDYGTNVYYDGDEVYYGDQPVATADQYYDQAQTIAGGQSDASPDAGEWKPLGVFGLVQGEQASASAVFQLATNKDGAIGGNFCDMLTDSTLPVHGSVDKQTQRAAWTVGDNKSTVYDTGIVNLTKDEAPLLVHLGPDRTQQWMLVRLKQPEQAKQPSAEQK